MQGSVLTDVSYGLHTTMNVDSQGKEIGSEQKLELSVKPCNVNLAKDWSGTDLIVLR